jgi:hypothetical protein
MKLKRAGSSADLQPTFTSGDDRLATSHHVSALQATQTPTSKRGSP